MANNTTLKYDLDGSITAFQIISVIISSFGLIANITLLYIFVVDRFFRKIIYYLMLICCVTDLISNTLIAVIYGAFLLSDVSLPVASTICKAFSFLIYGSYSVSLLNLSLIAAFRYISVVRAFSTIYLSHKNEFIIISEIIIWVVSFAVGIPDFFHVTARKNKRIMCDFTKISDNISIYLVNYVLINYIIPSVIIIILYWRIIVHQRNYSRPGQPSVQDKRDVDKKDKLVKSLIWISAFYIASTWPFFALQIAVAITQKTFLDMAYQGEAYFWLSMLSLSTTGVISVINPFLCFKFDENVRCRLKRRLLGKVRVNNRVKVTSAYPSATDQTQFRR